MELAALYLAHGVVRLLAVRAQTTELRREGLGDLEPIRVGAHVDHVAEPRVRYRAVVALEEVLADDLPVRVDLERDAVAEGERVDIDAGRGDELREVA